MKKQCVVLFSGGQDSTTCLLVAIATFGAMNVQALGFDYGQKHKQELNQAQFIASILKVDFDILPLHGLLGGSSLTDHTQDVNAPHKINGSLPSSFTAGRNALFLTIAGAYAYGIGVNTLMTGVCETDYSGYPDCRAEFVKSQQETLSLAMDKLFNILTPLMYINKAQTWKLAKEQGEKIGIDGVALIRDFTLTDYNGDMTKNEWGMGKLDNPASELRAKGYFEAKEKGWL